MSINAELDQEQPENRLSNRKTQPSCEKPIGSHVALLSEQQTMLSFAVLAAVVLVILQIISAQIPCDEAYGQHCPEASGFEVGDCLKKLDASHLSADCQVYINWHDVCREDIQRNCPGSEYTGDAIGESPSPAIPVPVVTSVCVHSLSDRVEQA